MDRLTRILGAIALVMMGLAIGFVGCYDLACRAAERSVLAAVPVAGISAGAQKYEEILAIIEQCYIGDEIDEGAMADAAAAAMVTATGDRWSYYVSAEDYQNYLDNMSNSYVGVGITITAYYLEDGTPVGYEVTDVVHGGPAEEAGVLPGDILTEVDGRPVVEMSLNETKQLVRGVEGTTVMMTYLRGEETLVLNVTRRSFDLVPATGELIEGTVGYISIDNFDANSADTVIGIMDDLKAQGATSFLFDVRNNPGGMKIELTKLLDTLLPEGTIFHSVDYTGAEEIVTSDPACVDMPMAVLVNANTYSAAEYFACALQEYGAGTIVGEHTFGKGYFQVGISLSDGSCLNLSIGKYFTPEGISLIDVGVTPDIEIALEDDLALDFTKGQLAYEDDPQLQAALGVLLD